MSDLYICSTSSNFDDSDEEADDELVWGRIEAIDTLFVEFFSSLDSLVEAVLAAELAVASLGSLIFS